MTDEELLKVLAACKTSLQLCHTELNRRYSPCDHREDPQLQTLWNAIVAADKTLVRIDFVMAKIILAGELISIDGLR